MGIKRETEKSFQSSVIDLAKLHGWRVAHFRKVPVARGGKVQWITPVAADGAGFPDLVCARNGDVLFFELKVGENVCTESQTAWLNAINGPVFNRACVYRPEDWDAIERRLK